MLAFYAKHTGSRFGFPYLPNDVIESVFSTRRLSKKQRSQQSKTFVNFQVARLKLTFGNVPLSRFASGKFLREYVPGISLAINNLARYQFLCLHTKSGAGISW